MDGNVVAARPSWPYGASWRARHLTSVRTARGPMRCECVSYDPNHPEIGRHPIRGAFVGCIIFAVFGLALGLERSSLKISRNRKMLRRAFNSSWLRVVVMLELTFNTFN